MTTHASREPIETGLFLDGTRCSGCVRRIERSLQELPGVVEATVNYTTRRALVRHIPEHCPTQTLVARVSELGYAATPFDPRALDRSRAERQGARAALVRVLVAGFLAGNVMLIAFALYFGADSGIDAQTRRALRWLAVALTAPSIGWCALPFWRGAWSGVQQRTITMDLPIVLAISVAFGVHVVGTWAESAELFVDSAATIVFLILLGRTLERGARARAASAIDQLTALTPRHVLRRSPSGDFEPVDPRELRVGDRILVPPGQVVPADGTIRAGATELDESLLTGESQPVARRLDDPVVGGSHNRLAEIEVEVSATVAAGTLSRLAALLERAQADRPDVQRFADRVATVFAPALLAVAALSVAYLATTETPALEIALRAAAVLIVACPCALGLATPTAITAAIGRAAQLGILVKRGDALERLARIDHVLLDKTGTLTEGRFHVDTVRVAPGYDEDHVLALAHTAEGHSTHPIAEAIEREFSERRLADRVNHASHTRVERQTFAGRGVEARAGDRRILVGTLAHLRCANVRICDKLYEGCGALDLRGLTSTWVADGLEAVGVIGLSDRPRADAQRTIARLRTLGARIELVSGDDRPAVELARKRAGIRAAESFYRVSPEAKLEHVQGARGRGARIASVGDGINDAAALGASDVGIALARGADVTLHAADLVILSPRLGALTDSIELARACVRRIRENFGVALCYNATAIPLALAGVLDPLTAALAMSASSLVVTGNAARLLGWKPRE